MNQLEIYSPEAKPSDQQIHAIAEFLHKHLEKYGDELPDILKAMNYALGENNSPGGAIFILKQASLIVAAVVVNKTGMQGYIPENILVYIASHQQMRGQGLGKQMMQSVIGHVQGSIALHVEPDNPAKRLYEKLGFNNKYLEMRLQR